METGPVDLRKRCCHRNRSLRRLLGGGGGVTPASRRPSEEFRARRRRRKFVITCARIQVTTGAPPPLYPPPPLLPLTCTHRRNFCQFGVQIPKEPEGRNWYGMRGTRNAHSVTAAQPSLISMMAWQFSDLTAWQMTSLKKDAILESHTQWRQRRQIVSCHTLPSS